MYINALMQESLIIMDWVYMNAMIDAVSCILNKHADDITLSYIEFNVKTQPDVVISIQWSIPDGWIEAQTPFFIQFNSFLDLCAYLNKIIGDLEQHNSDEPI